MPPAARALSTLSRADYEDAFLLEIGSARERTAEQWARATLEDAPMIMRNALHWGWFALGLQLSSARSERYVLGWQVQVSTPRFVLLAANSRLGLPAQLLFWRQPDTLLFCTFVQRENAIVRAVWAAVQRVHVQVVPLVLEQASLRERRRH
jgi:hypothetical protein